MFSHIADTQQIKYKSFTYVGICSTEAISSWGGVGTCRLESYKHKTRMSIHG